MKKDNVIKDAIALDSNMKISSIENESYRWIDPLHCDEIKILGFNWIQTEMKYRRMPVCEPGYLPPGVDNLANCCAGGQLKFVTNSPRLAIDAEFAYSHSMDHMTPTGQMGFDCYTGKCGNMLYASTARFNIKDRAYTAPLFSGIEQKERLFTINFPLYNSELKKLFIGIAPDALISAPEKEPDKKIVVYGTSITQGGCANRPGMCYTNILSRVIDAEFINLGFSGNGKGQPSVIDTIAAINDMDLLVIDYEANINDGIYENLPVIITTLRNKHPNLPILIVSRIKYGQENIRPENEEKAIKRRDFQKEFVEKRKQNGDQNIDFFDGRVLLDGNDPGEYAVDGCHLTDAGFIKMANGLQSVIKKVSGIRY